MIKKKSLLKIILLFLVFFGILGMKNYCKASDDTFTITKDEIIKKSGVSVSLIRSVVWPDGTTYATKTYNKNYTAMNMSATVNYMDSSNYSTKSMKVAFTVPAKTVSTNSTQPTTTQTQQAKTEIRVQATARIALGTEATIEVTTINPTSPTEWDSNYESVSVLGFTYSGYSQKKISKLRISGKSVGTTTFTFTCGNAEPKTLIVTVYQPSTTQIDLASSASVSLGGRQNVGVIIRNPTGPASVNVNNNNVSIEGGLVETERLSNQIKYNLALKGNAVGTTNITIICGGQSKMMIVNCYKPQTTGGDEGQGGEEPVNNHVDPGSGAGNVGTNIAGAGGTGTGTGVITSTPTTTTTPVYVAPTPPPDTTAPVIESITANVDMSKEFHNEYKITYLLVFSEPIKDLNESFLTVQDITNKENMKIKQIYRSGSSYKKWKVQVISKKAKYEQKFTLKKNTVEDNAGNKNKAGKSLTLKIDRCKPAIIVNGTIILGKVVNNGTAVTSGTTPTNTTATKIISSSDTISVSFSIREANPIEYVKNSKKTTYINRLCDRCLKYENSSSEQKTKVSNKIKEYITVTVGGKKDDSLQLWLKRDGNREENGKKMEDYTLTIKNVTRSGKIKVQLNKGISKDLAGNETTAKNLIDGTLTADNKKPTIKTISISSNNGNPKYAKNGDTLTLTMTSNTNFEDLAEKPTIWIGSKKDENGNWHGGKKMTFADNLKGTTWVAIYTIDDEESGMNEGVLDFSIQGYKKSNDLVGTTRRKTTDGTSIIYDRTAPELNGKIYYNVKNKKETNEIWQKKQRGKTTAKDNITKASKIITYYAWKKENESVVSKWTKIKNGTTMTISEGTGKYYLVVKYTDLAGNETVINTAKPFYVDNSVTKAGSVTATKGTKTGAKYTSGTFVSDNIYLTLNDGKDEESGLKDNYYIVSKEKSDGTYVNSGKNIGDTILSQPGHYKVTTYTHDNLGNEGTRELEIFKETGNVQITNLTEYQDTKKKITNRAHFNVKITDKANTYSKVEYAWLEKGTDESKLNYINVEDWQITKMKSDTGIDAYGPKDKNGNYIQCNGTYILCIRTTDSKGNVNVVKSEEVNVYNTISDENMPTLEMKTVNQKLEETGEYENDSWTNSSVIIKINNENKKDDFGNTITDVSYEIKKDGENYIGAGATGDTILTEEGKYTIKLSAKNGLGGTGVKTYSVKIDKTKPTAEFSGTSAYGTSSKITIKLSDYSGFKEKGNRYYWSRSMQAPKVSDFYGNLEGDVRGDIIPIEQEIKAPSDVSGMWYLWLYTIDLAGNTAIIGSYNPEGNIPANIDNEKPIPGEIVMKVKDENGKVYTPNDGWTKENIYLSLIPGYDADSGVKSNTYSINKDGKSYKVNLTEPTTLEEEGEYEIIVTTVDNQNNQETRSYTLKIDKSAPTIVINPINGNENWATKQSAEVKITDEKSGVNNSKTKVMWIGSDEDYYETYEDIKNEVSDIIGEETINEHMEEINNEGIYIYNATIENDIVKTPDGINGKYYIYVRTEDNLGQANLVVSDKPYFVTNTNPTTPYSVATIKENIGTQEKEVRYSGEITNKKVNAYAMYSDCLSGISGYEVKYKKLEDQDWSAWENATTKKNILDEEIICGYKEFTEEGIYVVKFRAVSELYKELPTSKTKDAKLYSEETEEIAININLTGPEVSFVNYDGGKNGSEEAIKEIKVKATATDENEGNLETLRYAWVKFNSLSEFNTFKNSKHTIEELKAKMTNTTTFANGEEIPSPEGAEGIYSLFVYAEDKLGNASVHYSNYYIFNITGPEVKFANSENTKYGNEEEISSGKVKVTVTDENKVNNESLKYSWVKFNSVEEFETFKNGKYTLNELKARMINTTRFTNEREISTPEGAEGIYSLFVYSEDSLGNASINYSYYYKLLVKKNITETIDENFAYKYKENTIYRVKPETTVASFIESIDKTFKLTNYQVFDKQGKEIKAEDYSTTLITTNCKVKIKDLTADISVIGDLNADGHFNSVDLTRMRFNLIGKIELTKVEKFSADINNDNNINTVDLTRMRFILIGVSEI